MKVTCPDAPHLHTAEEVAALLKTTPEAVKGAASHGRIPKTRCGRHVRFSDENIAQIIADGLIPPKGEKTPERRVLSKISIPAARITATSPIGTRSLVS